MEHYAKKKKNNETHFTTNIDDFLNFTPSKLNVNVFFPKLKKNFILFITKFKVLVLCFPYFTYNSTIYL
jgi:hypothetical protein